MLRKTSSLIIVELVLLFSLNSTSAGQTSNNPIIDRLKSTLIDMGYSVAPTRSGLTVKDGSYQFGFNLYPDSLVAGVYETYSIPKEKTDKIPLREMLIFNDTHRVYFAVSRDFGTISINESLSVKDINPSSLKRIIDDISTVDRDMQVIFNPANWK